MDQSFFENLGRELVKVSGSWTHEVNFAVMKVAEIRVNQAIQNGEVYPHDHYRMTKTLVSWAKHACEK